MQILNPHKIGDTFTLKWSLPIVFGSLIDTVESQIRDCNDTLIESLTVVQLADTATPRFVKTKFEYTLSFARNDESVIPMAKLLKWKKEFLDELFELAKTLK